MANRFDQIINPARFSPLSFEEMSFAPIMLRGREDEIMNTRDELLNEMANIEVLENFQDEVDAEKMQLTNEINTLAETIQKEGAGNLNYLNQFRNLRNKYNKMVSSTGNIGRAAQAKVDIDTMRQVYLEDAINNKKQPADRAIQKFEEEVQKYVSGLPSELSKFKGSLPEFTPAFAPNSVGLIDEMNKISEMATGINTEELGDFFFERAPDGSLVAYNRKTGEQTNNSQIDALGQLLEKTLLDPNSDLNRNLVWRGIDPEEYLDDIDNLINMKRKVASSDVSTYAGQLRAPATESSDTDTLPEPGKGVLQATSAGRKVITNSFDSNTITEELKNIQSDDSITDNEKARKTTLYNHALQDKLQLEENQKFKDEMKTNLSTNPYWASRGVTTYDDYIKYTEPVTALGNTIRKTLPKTGSPEIDKLQKMTNEELVQEFNNPTSKYSNIFGEDNINFRSEFGGARGSVRNTVNGLMSGLETQKQQLRKEYSRLSNELLEPSTFYLLGLEEDDLEFRNLLNKSIENLDVVALQNSGLMELANEEGLFSATMKRANSTQTGEEGERFEKFNTQLSNASDVKWDLIGINDGGTTSASQLVFNVKAKVGKNNVSHNVAIELNPDKLGAVSEQFLDPKSTFYQKMNPEARRVLDGIRDKNRYGDTATDLRRFMNSGTEVFDSKGTASVKANAQQALSDQGINVKRSDSTLAKHLFISPFSDNDYSVLINEDDSYTAYKRDSSGNVTEMNFNDYAMKQVAMTLHKAGRINELETEKDFWTKWGKANALYNLREMLPNLEETKGAVVYSLDDNFLEGVRKYDTEIHNLSKEKRASQPAIDRAAELFDQYIGSLTMRSKLFKEIL